MKLAPECRSCLLTRIAEETKLVTDDEDVIRDAVFDCAKLYDERCGENVSASVIAGAVHRLCYDIAGSNDPYVFLKEQDNRIAEAVAKEIAPMLSTLHDYITAAVIGNAMDYGVAGHEIAKNFTGYFHEMFERGLAHDDTEKILALAERVVYFTDNCGEVIFDKLLMQKLRENGSFVTAVVKDQPMLNDVTLKEAEELCLRDSADEVFHAGGAQLGVHPQFFPPETASAVKNATLIISKGLANYESLTEYEGLPRVAYLMTVKCEPVARHIGAKKGDLVAIVIPQSGGS